MMVTSKPVSNYRKLRKAVRYSATIPFDIITKKNQLLDFEGHKNDKNVRTLLDKLEKIGEKLKVLGSYPRAIE